MDYHDCACGTHSQRRLIGAALKNSLRRNSKQRITECWEEIFLTELRKSIGSLKKRHWPFVEKTEGGLIDHLFAQTKLQVVVRHCGIAVFDLVFYF
jgi:hypothetical protein